jgi:antitoxin (DNA-binding transcriptional repressor) of toxin-antitoxin stability system
MRTVSVTEIARNFSEYLNRVAFRGERFILTRGSKEVAELRPRRRGVPLREFAAGLAAGPHLTEEEAKDFLRDVEDARRRAATLPVRDPWEPREGPKTKARKRGRSA